MRRTLVWLAACLVALWMAVVVVRVFETRWRNEHPGDSRAEAPPSPMIAVPCPATAPPIDTQPPVPGNIAATGDNSPSKFDVPAALGTVSPPTVATGRDSLPSTPSGVGPEGNVPPQVTTPPPPSTVNLQLPANGTVPEPQFDPVPAPRPPSAAPSSAPPDAPPTSTSDPLVAVPEPLPSGHNLQPPPQYFRESPPYPLTRELASMEAAAAGQAIGPGAPVPPPVPVPAPAQPVPGPVSASDGPATPPVPAPSGSSENPPLAPAPSPDRKAPAFPWTFQVSVNEGRTQLEAKIGKDVQFIVACDDLAMQTPSGRVHAAGNVTIRGQNVEATCSSLTLTWNDDRLSMQGNVILKCKQDGRDVDLAGDKLSMKLAVVETVPPPTPLEEQFKYWGGIH